MVYFTHTIINSQLVMRSNPTRSAATHTTSHQKAAIVSNYHKLPQNARVNGPLSTVAQNVDSKQRLRDQEECTRRCQRKMDAGAGMTQSQYNACMQQCQNIQ
jgi:hypothetical protein